MRRVVRIKRLLAGLVLVTAGGVGMATLIAAAYGQSAACQALAMRLGIISTLILSALAQSALLFGAALVYQGLEPLFYRPQDARA